MVQNLDYLRVYKDEMFSASCFWSSSLLYFSFMAIRKGFQRHWICKPNGELIVNYRSMISQTVKVLITCITVHKTCMKLHLYVQYQPAANKAWDIALLFQLIQILFM